MDDYNATAVIRRALESVDMKFQYDADVFVFDMTLDSQISNARFFFKKIPNGCFLCVAKLPVEGDTKNRDMMLALSELTTRINYQILHGRFVMDFSDGELRWELPYPCWGGAEFSHIAVLATISTITGAIKRFAPCILGVIFGGKSAEDAFKLAKEED